MLAHIRNPSEEEDEIRQDDPSLRSGAHLQESLAKTEISTFSGRTRLKNGR